LYVSASHAIVYRRRNAAVSIDGQFPEYGFVRLNMLQLNGILVAFQDDGEIVNNFLLHYRRK
jgi:hypothetical protein